MQERVVFRPNIDSGFASTVKKRVDAYFKDHDLSKKANALMRLKTGFYFASLFILYSLLIIGPANNLSRLAIFMLLGFTISEIGLNVGHDAIHGAYSLKPTNNKFMSYAFDLIGASSYTWGIRHNILHHTYTNIIGSDGDLESMALLRFYVKPGRKFYHRFQHFYAPFLYGFVTLVWVLKKDYGHILEESKGLHSRRKPPTSAYVSLFTFKLFHYALFLFIPMFVLKIIWWKALLGFFAMHFIAGLTLACVFQLAHCVEGPAFVPARVNNTVVDTWVEHQMKTTANFAPTAIASWFCGGLNYQIEHHLFPQICHVHYPALSPIVQQTALEFDLPYYVHQTFFKAFSSHLRMLKFFGTTDPVALS